MEILAGLHEKIIHFPIALLITYPVIELIAFFSKKDFFSKASLLFLFIGVLGALAAVISGNQSFTLNPDLSEKSMIIFRNHEFYANITMWLFSAILIFRYYLTTKKKLTSKIHLIILLLALSGIYFVYQTGYYGGELAKQKLIDITRISS
jgi:uncharacterized membrane protein